MEGGSLGGEEGEGEKTRLVEYHYSDKKKKKNNNKGKYCNQNPSGLWERMEEGEVLILSNGKRAAQGAGTARFFRTLLMRVQIVKSVTGKDSAS